MERLFLFLFIIVQVVPKQIVQQQMRNNYVPSYPFQKKQLQIPSKTTPTFLLRNVGGVQDNVDRKRTVDADLSCQQAELILLNKHIQTTQEESINSDQPSSCKSSEITTKPSKITHKMVRQQRIISPKKYDNLSPFNSKPSPSPNLKQSTLITNNFAPIRATLRNLISAKGSPINKNQQQLSTLGTHSTRELQLNSSVRANKTATELYQTPMKNIEKENQILREQNELLRHELSQIKKNLLSNAFGSKKEDLVSNLRNTIKKEDGQIKELKIKLQIFTKKNAALTTLIQNKDQEINFLSNKITHMEEELQQLRNYKENGMEKTYQLKEKLNLIMKSYNQLQAKWNKSQVDWLSFQQKWMQQKGIYLHRISFLEEYISNN